MEKEVILKELNNKDVEKFWKEKEQEIGEEIKGKDISEYIGGYQGVRERTWGLLYYTESSFYFQIFPRKNWLTSLMGNSQSEFSNEIKFFRIQWEKVIEIFLPQKRKFFLSIFSPADYRVSIRYWIDGQEDTLVLIMYSRNSRDRFIDCYNQFKNKR